MSLRAADIAPAILRPTRLLAGALAFTMILAAGGLSHGVLAQSSEDEEEGLFDPFAFETDPLPAPQAAPSPAPQPPAEPQPGDLAAANPPIPVQRPSRISAYTLSIAPQAQETGTISIRAPLTEQPQAPNPEPAQTVDVPDPVERPAGTSPAEPAPASDPQPDETATVGLRPTARPETAATPQRDRTVFRRSRSNGPALLEQVMARGTLRVGTALLAPYAMRDASGNLIGHEVDIALAIANDLDVELELVSLPFRDLIDAVQDDRVDMIIAGLSITPDRALRVAFTRPYATTGVQLVTTYRAGRGRSSTEDFNDPETTIGVAVGTPSELAAERRFPKAKIVRFASHQDAKNALLDGTVPALVASSPFPEVLVAQSPDDYALPLDAPLSETAEGLAIRHGEPEFLAYLNAWIVARRMDEFLPKTKAYWFKSTDWLPRLTEKPVIDNG